MCVVYLSYTIFVSKLHWNKISQSFYFCDDNTAAEYSCNTIFNYYGSLTLSTRVTHQVHRRSLPLVTPTFEVHTFLADVSASIRSRWSFHNPDASYGSCLLVFGSIDDKVRGCVEFSIFHPQKPHSSSAISPTFRKVQMHQRNDMTFLFSNDDPQLGKGKYLVNYIRTSVNT